MCDFFILFWNFFNFLNIMYFSFSCYCVSCLIRFFRGVLWYSFIMYYGLKGCWMYFLVLNLGWLLRNLGVNCCGVNKSRFGISNERRMVVDWDDYLRFGYNVNRCLLSIIRYCGNSFFRGRGWIFIFILRRKKMDEKIFCDVKCSSF